MGDGVDSGLMSKFCHGKQLGPFFGFIRSEQPQIRFQFLIYPFRFPVHLRMVGCGKGNIVLKKAGEFSCEGRGELWSSIGDYLGMETKSRKNIGEKKLGHPFRINVFVQGQ